MIFASSAGSQSPGRHAATARSGTCPSELSRDEGTNRDAPSPPPLSPEIRETIENERLRCREKERVRDRVEELEWEVRSARRMAVAVSPPRQEPTPRTTAGTHRQHGHAGSISQRGGQGNNTPRDRLTSSSRSPRRLVPTPRASEEEPAAGAGSYPPQGIRSPRASSSTSVSVSAPPQQQVARPAAHNCSCVWFKLRVSPPLNSTVIPRPRHRIQNSSSFDDSHHFPDAPGPPRAWLASSSARRGTASSAGATGAG